MANDIRQKIVLDGEKEYNAALKEAQRNLKTLRSELKAETAELGNNATAQQKNELKTKSLQKQIKEQEKIVSTYKNALEEVREKYGDNNEAIAKWEQKLNDARTTLANMKNSIDSVGDAFKNIDSDAQMGIVATKSLADAMKSVGDAAGSIASSMENAFAGVLDTLTDAVSVLWDEVMKVATKANQWTDIADYFGSTANEVQKWSNAIQGAGGNFDNFTTILNRFKTGGVNQKITEWFGISDVNYTNDLQYTLAVLDAMVKKRDEMMNAGTWDSALSEIFGGRRSQAAGWFISNWDTIQTNAARYDTEAGGVGMTDEHLKTMNQLYTDVQNLSTTWESFKQSFLAGAFGKLSLDLVGNAQGILDAFISFMSAENDSERNAAIQQIEDNMTSFFTRLGEAIEAAAKALDKVGTDLAGSENGYVAAIGNVLKSLSDVLEWMTNQESLEQIKRFFDTLFGIWVGSKAVTALANVAAFATNIGTIVSHWGHAGVQQALGGGSGSGSGILAGVGAVAAKVLPAAAGVGLVVADSLNNHGDENQWTEEEIREIRAKNGLYAGEDWRWREEIENGTAQLAMSESQWAAAQNFWDAFRANPSNFTDEQWDAFESAFSGQAELFDKLNTLMDTLYIYDEGESWRGIEDLPADWWINSGSGNSGLTSEDVSGFKNIPNLMAAAVRTGVSGIKVNMDGQAVGNIVAPYVSEQIARDIG